MNIKKLNIIVVTIALLISNSIVWAEETATVNVQMTVPEYIAAPTNLSASAGNTQVTLTWTKTTDPNLSNQIISISEDGGDSYSTLINAGVAETYLIEDLTNGQQYTFKVVSVDNYGRESLTGATTTASPRRGGGSVSVDSHPYCGNFMLEGSEECDDGNLTNGDGCSSICLIEGETCGNGQVESAEQCDDGNNLDGDGCSAFCFYEDIASQVVPPEEDVVKTNSINLIIEIFDPQEAFSYYELYYSLNGEEYKQYGENFTTTTIQMTNLAEGVYQVYTVAVDTFGNKEAVPDNPDAIFSIDLSQTINVSAYPEKRVPAENNWATTGSVRFYDAQSGILRYSFPVKTSAGGVVILEEKVAEGNYQVSFKGRSHLTSFLRNILVESGEDVDLDFSLAQNEYLLAGDVHSSKDDFVNALDISAAIKELYVDDIDADLNKDGIVNGLDLNMEVANLYEAGEQLTIN